MNIQVKVCPRCSGGNLGQIQVMEWIKKWFYRTWYQHCEDCGLIINRKGSK